MLAWRAIDQRMNAAQFRQVFEHFSGQYRVLGCAWVVL
jgi:hypothetical protein